MCCACLLVEREIENRIFSSNEVAAAGAAGQSAGGTARLTNEVAQLGPAGQSGGAGQLAAAWARVRSSWKKDDSDQIWSASGDCRVRDLSRPWVEGGGGRKTEMMGRETRRLL